MRQCWGTHKRLPKWARQPPPSRLAAAPTAGSFAGHVRGMAGLLGLSFWRGAEVDSGKVREGGLMKPKLTSGPTMAAEAKAKYDAELLRAMYTEMLFYRRFEERVNQ